MNNGKPNILGLSGAVPLEGGLPIVVDGHVIGAVGVSGATSADEDQELAVLGAGSLSEQVGSGNGDLRVKVEA